MKKKESGINFYQLIEHRNVPILTLDSRWHNLFPEHEKTEMLKKIETELNNALKRQGELNQENKTIKIAKNKLMTEILENMDATSNKADTKKVKKLEENQRLIIELNQKTADNEMELTAVPKNIQQINERLMIESLKICYANLEKNKQIIHKLDHWIYETRKKLRDNILMKQEKEIQSEEIYSTMHHILGPDIINFFDKKLGDTDHD